MAAEAPAAPVWASGVWAAIWEEGVWAAPGGGGGDSPLDPELAAAMLRQRQTTRSIFSLLRGR